MTLRPLLLALVLAPIGVALAIGCGGDEGDEFAVTDLGQVPTATLPNPLPEPLIVSGMSPGLAGVTYTVQSGDSLAAIADRFGTTAEAIAQANGISDPTQLAIGQVLAIPAATPEASEVLPATVEPTTAPAATPPPRPTPAPGASTYTVESGDIAAEIADRFGITLEELAAANDTSVDDLRDLDIGDVLLIPTPLPTATEEAPSP